MRDLYIMESYERQCVKFLEFGCCYKAVLYNVHEIHVKNKTVLKMYFLHTADSQTSEN